MRTTKRTTKSTNQFKRDIRQRQDCADEVYAVVQLLELDEHLPRQRCDHPLKGRWKGHRECHVRPDLLLIYCKPDADTLELARLGSHSELFRR